MHNLSSLLLRVISDHHSDAAVTLQYQVWKYGCYLRNWTMYVAKNLSDLTSSSGEKTPCDQLLWSSVNSKQLNSSSKSITFHILLCFLKTLTEVSLLKNQLFSFLKVSLLSISHAHKPFQNTTQTRIPKLTISSKLYRQKCVFDTISSFSNCVLHCAASSVTGFRTMLRQRSHIDRLAMNIPMSGTNSLITLPASAPFTLYGIKKIKKEQQRNICYF